MAAVASQSRLGSAVGREQRQADQVRANPRFVVINLPADKVGAQPLYEKVYCARRDMENRIKEHQLWLFADRTSTAKMRSNQLRLYFSTFAGVLMTLLRRFGLSGTELARATANTIRTRLLKIGARITVSRRRIRIAFASVYPLQSLFAHVLAALRAPPAPPDQGNPMLWRTPASGMRNRVLLLGLVFSFGALYDYLHGVAVPVHPVASGVDRGLFAR